MADKIFKPSSGTVVVAGLHPGDVAYLADGDYAVMSVALTGAPDNPIHIAPLPGANVRIDRLVVNNSSHVIMDGSGGLIRLESHVGTTSKYRPMLQQANGTGVVFRNMHVHHDWEDKLPPLADVRNGITLKTGAKVENCVIEDVLTAVTAETDCSAEYNHVRRTVQNVFQVTGNDAKIAHNVVTSMNTLGNRSFYCGVQSYDASHASAPNDQITYRQVMRHNKINIGIPKGWGLIQGTGTFHNGEISDNWLVVGHYKGVDFQHPFQSGFYGNMIIADGTNETNAQFRVGQGHVFATMFGDDARNNVAHLFVLNEECTAHENNHTADATTTAKIMEGC